MLYPDSTGSYREMYSVAGGLLGGRAMRTVATKPSVRTVLMRGAGRAFGAGMDLEMFSRQGMPEGFYEGQERAFRGLELMDKITIAAL